MFPFLAYPLPVALAHYLNGPAGRNKNNRRRLYAWKKAAELSAI